MKISDIYKNKGGKVLSFEIFPPKKDDELRNIEPTLDILSELRPDYISVTFGAGGSSNNNKSIELAKKIKNVYGIEPVVHLTCLSYTKQEIDGFVKELEVAGIENILALRGDINPNAPAKDDFKYASQLIEYLRPRTDVCIAGACYPEDHPDSKNHIEEMHNLKKKVDAGAQYLLSQLFFDNENFFRFEEDARIAGIDVPITPGIMPVINAGQIKRMIITCGASMPNRVLKFLDRYSDNKEALFDAGMAYAVNQIIDLITEGVDGIHLYTMNNPKVARVICDSVKNVIKA